MKDITAAGGSPSGDPSRERDYAIEIRNADGVLVARYTLYGVPILRLAYDLPVTLLATEEVSLVIKGINNEPPYDEVSPDVAFPSNQDGSPTPEVSIDTYDMPLQGPIDAIPDSIRQANIVNRQRVADLEIMPATKENILAAIAENEASLPKYSGDDDE